LSKAVEMQAAELFKCQTDVVALGQLVTTSCDTSRVNRERVEKLRSYIVTSIREAWGYSEDDGLDMLDDDALWAKLLAERDES
jgi:hypothetical protein